MKLLVFSDIHNDLRTLDRLMDTEADYYFAAGDLVSWAKGLDKAGEVLARRGDRVYVMPGNHESERQIEDVCGRHGLQFFHGRSIESSGWHIAGLGYSNITPFDTPGEYSEEELAERLSAFAGLKPLVLICHCPPKGALLDRGGKNQHYGSQAVLDFIRAQQPAHFLCGHVHEAEGVSERIGATIGVNVGKRGHLLEI